MTTDEARHRVAAYFRARLEASGLRPTTFAKRWGTNEKTLAKILNGLPIRGDAMDNIISAREWPPDAFERLARGQNPETDHANIEARVAAIEAHLGLDNVTPIRRRPTEDLDAVAAQGDASKRFEARKSPRKRRPSPPVENDQP